MAHANMNGKVNKRVARFGIPPYAMRDSTGEPEFRCRRSNRPGKLSGLRTVGQIELWRDPPVGAEGITISGERTEGARNEHLMCCVNVPGASASVGTRRSRCRS